MIGTTRGSDGRLLEELRRRNRATVQDLSKSTGVTQTAVRQKLNRLMGMGLVDRREIHAKRGRPFHAYALTERAGRLFGSNYADLALTLWQEVKRLDNRLIRREITHRVCEALTEKYRSQVRGGSLMDRLRGLKEVLAERGVEIEIDQQGPLPIIREHDCPYAELAETDHGICALEKQMFEKLLGSAVRLSQCRFDGHDCCEFETRPSSLKAEGRQA